MFCHRRHIMIAVIVLLIPAALRAQPLSDRVPAESIIYVGWSGTGHLGSNYEQSNLKAIIDASNFRQLIEETLPGVIQRVNRDNKEAGEALRIVAALAGPIVRHPTAVYVEGVDWENPRGPMPKVGLLCRAGADADSLLGMIQSLLAHVPQDNNAPPLKAFKVNDLIAITLGYRDDKQAVADGARSISTNETFKSAIGQVQKEPVSLVYINFEKMIGLVDRQVETGGGQEEKMYWPKVREALGISGIKRLVSTGGFDGKDWMTQCFIDAPAPRPGLLTMLDQEPASAEILQSIPKSASWLAVGRFDLAKLVRELRSGVGKVDDRFPQYIDMGLGAAQLALAMNLQADFLEPLGDEWAIFTDPSLTGRGPQGLAVINRLRKPDQALRAFKKFELFVDNTANGLLIGQRMRLTFERTQVAGLDIHYIQTPVVSPSWTVKDGMLIKALYPQTVAAVAMAASEKGNSITDNEKFNALRKRLGVEKASGICYVDLPAMIEGSYPLVLALTQGAVGAADMAGIKTPAMVVPPLPVLRKHLTPAGSVSWTDDKGWHSKSVSPFPFSGLLTIDQNMLLLAGAMGAAQVQARPMVAPAPLR